MNFLGGLLLNISLLIQADTIDRLGVPGPLKLGDTNFNIIWTDKPNDKYYIQEYLPDGQKLDSFNDMLTINLFITGITTEAAVKQKVEELNSRKRSDPVCNYKVNVNSETKEYLVDFLVSDFKNNNDMTMVEFNVYRYKQIDLGENSKAMLVFVYSKRSYGNKITPFLKSLVNERVNYLKQLAASDLPSITLEIEK